MTTRACARLENQSSFKHSSWNRPLNDSISAFCVGLPSWSSGARATYVSIARQRTSRPLWVGH